MEGLYKRGVNRSVIHTINSGFGSSLDEPLPSSIRHRAKEETPVKKLVGGGERTRVIIVHPNIDVLRAIRKTISDGRLDINWRPSLSQARNFLEEGGGRPSYSLTSGQRILKRAS